MSTMHERAITSRNGRYRRINELFGSVSEAWDTTTPLRHTPGSRQIFHEAMHHVAQEVNRRLPQAQQSEAILAGAGVTAYFAHTMAEFARQEGMDSSEYRSRLTQPDTIGVLNWITGIKRNLATTIEDMIGMRNNDNFGGIDRKLGYYVATAEGFALKDPMGTLFDAAYTYKAFFDAEKGYFSTKCHAASSGMTQSIAEATAQLTATDPRLLHDLLP